MNRTEERDAWTATVHTDTTPPWMIPEYPLPNDTVTVRIRISREAPVESVFVRAILNGVDRDVPAPLEREGDRFAWYRALFVMSQPSTHFHIRVRTTDGRTLSITRLGPSWVYPNEDHDYTVDTRSRTPEWVRSSVFYQVFPDRFARGDQHLGVADGEITRGEFASTSMEWGDRPLPYSEGGSLDFFNGDLPGIEAKLDYLADLGVSALYLTPIFAAKTNHRYDCLDYFSVDPHLGGDEALVSLLRAAHARGIRIVLDVSINHVGVEHPWARGMKVGDRLVRVVAEDEEGRAVNWAGVPDLLKLDYTVAELRDTIYRRPDSVVQRYLREPFRIDGWRFDVASETGRLGAQQNGHELWREIRSAIKAIDPDAYIVGEHWHDSSRYLQGDQWDSAMNYFACGRALRMWLGEEDRFARVPAVEAAPGRRIRGDELKVLLDQHFTRIPSGAVHAQFNLIDSHDVTRLHTNEAVFDWALYEGVVMLAFLLPGTFSIYYGDEVGIDGSLDGDHGKRYPMPWAREAWDRRFLELYRSMAALKRASDVLHRGSYRVLDCGDDYLVYARFTDVEAIVLVLNRSAQRRELTVNVSCLGVTAVTLIGPGAATHGRVDLRGETLACEPEPKQSLLLRCTVGE
ncbi:MAG: alpha-amylase family glycosyl hydrolase [Spirochaetales bacterium]